MKLYKVPKGSKIQILPEHIGQTPPDSEDQLAETILKFHHIDGMYSVCTNDKGERIYLAGWTEVRIIEP